MHNDLVKVDPEATAAEPDVVAGGVVAGGVAATVPVVVPPVPADEDNTAVAVAEVIEAPVGLSACTADRPRRHSGSKKRDPDFENIVAEKRRTGIRLLSCYAV